MDENSKGFTRGVGLGVDKDYQTVIAVAKSRNIDILSLVVPAVMTGVSKLSDATRDAPTGS